MILLKFGHEVRFLRALQPMADFISLRAWGFRVRVEALGRRALNRNLDSLKHKPLVLVTSCILASVADTT